MTAEGTMKRHEIIQRVIILIGFGLLLLWGWYEIEGPKNIVNAGQKYADDPVKQLLVIFYSWLTLIGSIASLMVGFAGCIRLLIRK